MFQILVFKPNILLLLLLTWKFTPRESLHYNVTIYKIEFVLICFTLWLEFRFVIITDALMHLYKLSYTRKYNE